MGNIPDRQNGYKRRMTIDPELPPIAVECVEWETFEQGRFGSRFRHLTRAVVGE